MYCNPEMGFKISNMGEMLLYFRWLYWKNGICSRDFNLENFKDVKDIIEIDNAVKSKELRESQINKMMSKVKF